MDRCRACESGVERGANNFDVAFATELADETAARLQTIRHAFDDFSGSLHPMQRGIGKDGIETLLEAQRWPSITATIRPRCAPLGLEPRWHRRRSPSCLRQRSFRSARRRRSQDPR